MKIKKKETQIAELLKVLGVPFRIKLLYVLEGTEACVCHLEHHTGKRQAYISQHLKALKESGLVDTRRDGKYIFYQVTDPEIYELLAIAEKVLGIPVSLKEKLVAEPETKCSCPKCSDQ